MRGGCGIDLLPEKAVGCLLVQIGATLRQGDQLRATLERVEHNHAQFLGEPQIW